MRLITGGAYQGKLAYAKEQYQIQEGWIDGRTCTAEEIFSCRGIFQFHELVRRMLCGETNLPDQVLADCKELTDLEQEAARFAEQLYRKNPEIVIVTNELGCGIVPMEREARMWREAVGRICTLLAAKSEEVVRVLCGIGMKIKEKEK